VALRKNIGEKNGGGGRKASQASRRRNTQQRDETIRGEMDLEKGKKKG